MIDFASDERTRRNARRLADEMREEDGVRDAVNVIEQLTAG